MHKSAKADNRSRLLVRINSFKRNKAHITCWMLWPEGKCFFPYLFHYQEYQQHLCRLRMRSSSVVRLIFSFPIIIIGNDQLTAIVAGKLLRISCLCQQAVQLPASFNHYAHSYAYSKKTKQVAKDFSIINL